ncbi:hypothetical protein S101413_02072 [Bacillus velezensis]|nr:hypothetical protein S101413_02072 [Bacillus velezensis]
MAIADSTTESARLFLYDYKNKGESANLIAFSYQEKEGHFILHREVYIPKGFY